MIRDPIVQEIHNTRAKLLDAWGDLDRLMDQIKNAEAQDEGRVITAQTLRLTRQWAQKWTARREDNQQANADE